MAHLVDHAPGGLGVLERHRLLVVPEAERAQDAAQVLRMPDLRPDLLHRDGGRLLLGGHARGMIFGALATDDGIPAHVSPPAAAYRRSGPARCRARAPPAGRSPAGSGRPSWRAPCCARSTSPGSW